MTRAPKCVAATPSPVLITPPAAASTLTLADLDEKSRTTPVIANIRPTGKTYLMEDFFYAGGLRALMERLGDRLHRDCITVTGHTLGEGLAGAEVHNDDVIRPLYNPVYHEGLAGAAEGQPRSLGSCHQAGRL